MLWKQARIFNLLRTNILLLFTCRNRLSLAHLSAFFFSSRVTNRHCSRFVFLCHVCTQTHTHTRLCCWMSHPPCESDSGARRRRQARQPTVCRLLPQIEPTSHPERWAVMCFIWRQAINSLPAQRGKQCAPCTRHLHLAGKYFTSPAPELKIWGREGWCSYKLLFYT